MQKLESKHVLPYVLYGAKMLTKKNLLDKKDRIWTLQPSNFPNNWNNDFNSKICLKPLNTLLNCEEIDSFNIPLGLIISLNDDNIQNMPFKVVQKLIELQYDIFGLIEKGLAVDINTLSVE